MFCFLKGKRMSRDKIVAIGFLTRDDLSALGANFRRHFAIDDSADFAHLIERLDRIDLAASEIVDRTELEMQRRAEKNANPLAPPINNRAGS
jgi:hypothetical protein